jgi:Helix-turn-helix domain
MAKGVMGWLRQLATGERPDEAQQLDLGFPKIEPAAVVPIARPKSNQAAAVGWHGMRIAQLNVNWSLAVELSRDGAACMVLVEPRSPARKAQLRSGDYVVSASPSLTADMSLEDLDQRSLPPGTEIFVKFHRPGRPRGDLQTTVVRLRAPPRSGEAPDGRRAAVAVGRRVPPGERKKFLAQMTTNRRITDPGHRILTRLLLHHDGDGGIFPAVATIARDVGLKKRAAQNHIRRLQRAGVLEVQFGGGQRTETGRTNRYVVCWPEGWGQTVVELRSR